MVEQKDDDDDHERKCYELEVFLQAINKSQLIDKFVTAGIFMEDLSSEDVDTLAAKGIPKMIARLCKTKADETEELRDLLGSMGGSNKKKTMGYLKPLVDNGIITLEAVSTADVTSIDGIPKMIARIIQKKSNEMMKKRDLTIFLKERGKEKYLDDLWNLGIEHPKQLREFPFPTLSKIIPKMVARSLTAEAKKLFGYDNPKYDTIFEQLSAEEKSLIRSTWEAIQAADSSAFGENFYRNLIELDPAAQLCLQHFPIASLGRLLDRELDGLIDVIDSSPQDFVRIRDYLIQRMIKYKVYPECFWFGSQAFMHSIFVVNSTTIEAHNQIRMVWRKLYFSIFPPLHPVILKSIQGDMEALSNEHDFDSFDRHFNDDLNYTYFATWFQNQIDFKDRMTRFLSQFIAWRDGRGSWSDFEESAKGLLDGMQPNSNKVIAFLNMVITERPDSDMGLANILTAAAFSLFGAGTVLEVHHEDQKELVWQQWLELYTHAKAFAPAFGERFVQVPRVMKAFGDQATDMVMQPKVFVDQLNVVLNRLNEDLDKVLVPILVDLGAKHRIPFHIDSDMLPSFIQPLMETLEEFIGRMRWTRKSRSAWAYVLQFMLHCMLLGWYNGNKDVRGVQEFKRLKNLFVEKKVEIFDRKFFDQFGKSLDPTGALVHRVQKICYIVLSEGKCSQMNEIFAFGRRERQCFSVVKSKKVLVDLATEWMQIGMDAFGESYTTDVATEWASLWDLLASSVSPAYAATLEMAPEFLVAIVKPTTMTPQKRQTTIAASTGHILTLVEKTSYAESQIVRLKFRANGSVTQRAGQFAKLQVKLSNGHKRSRYYSIASSPDPITWTAREFDFLIKEVKGGAVSSYLFNEMEVTGQCRLLTTAGNFVLPKAPDGHQRLMVSAGIGIVAFLSAIRSVVKLVQLESIDKKINLGLIHSERKFPFPCMEELLAVAKEYSPIHEKFSFDLRLVYTGHERNAQLQALDENGDVTLYRHRLTSNEIKEALDSFADPMSVHLYACGPKAFQKGVRSSFLNTLGHDRKRVHLEFFDL